MRSPRRRSTPSACWSTVVSATSFTRVIIAPRPPHLSPTSPPPTVIGAARWELGENLERRGNDAVYRTRATPRWQRATIALESLAYALQLHGHREEVAAVLAAAQDVP